MKKELIGYIAAMILLCCAMINLRCEQKKARQQAKFQTALVENSNAHLKALRQDSTVIK